MNYVKSRNRRLEDIGWEGKNYSLPDCPARSDDAPLLDSIEIGRVLMRECTETRKVLSRKAEGYTQRDIAEEIGKSRTTVCNTLKTVRRTLEREGLF